MDQSSPGKLVSETYLEGFGTTIIMYRDFCLSIPEVPQVADVDEEVVLEIDFVAAAGDRPISIGPHEDLRSIEGNVR